MSTCKKNVEASIIIPAFNEAATIKQCLNAICSGSFSNFEIIVIDDASNDNCASIVASYPDSRVKLIGNIKSIGPTGCFNYGASQARGKYLLFTDADCIADPHWIEQAVQSFSSGEACAVEGAIRYEISATKIWHKIPLNPYYNITRDKNISVEHQDYANGNFAIERKYFELLEGFNSTRYPNGREDTDLGLRLSRLGKIYFNNNMVVTHKAEVWTFNGLLKNTKRYAADVRVLKDHGKFPYMLGKIIHPRFLLLLFFPPLIFLYYEVRSFRSLCFVPKFLVYIFCLRLVIWKTAVSERVFLI
jgi:glycosyltransferase involved in cell wall biosynthesis